MPKRSIASARAISRGLADYKAKRDFSKTGEPAGKRRKAAGNSFVVQEHHARSHHFDFRLEMDGVLVSWAVPKGVPEDLSAKRLAVHVEDHPLEYGAFEGEIPEGSYGAGTVAIWDKGTWTPVTRTWRKDFAAGKLKFHLHGTRLHGEYLLVRSKDAPDWFFRKLSEEGPAAAPGKPGRPGFVPFQLAKVAPTVPSGDDWLHEIKLDGYRLMAVKERGEVRLFTRNGHDWSDRFGNLPQQIAALSAKDFVLDGEAVVFDSKGRSDFGALQAALKPGSEAKVTFVVFDLLHLDGINLQPLALSARLESLDGLLTAGTGRVRRSKVWPAASGAALFKEACKLELEGIISKKASEPYSPGRREWTKCKCRPRQEFIVCGYLPPKGSLPAFGALVLGTIENGKLVPRGKVGTGFQVKERRALVAKMERLRTEMPAFKIPDREVVWIRPKLVAEVEYAEITRQGAVRQASFIGIREDRGADDIHLEGVQSATAEAKDAKVAGITISHPERIVYPGDGVTKMQVAEYFERVGELMLPFVANRPLALLRAPSGVGGQLFFQKSFEHHRPPRVFARNLDDGSETLFVKDVRGLVSLAQFGVIEFHPWGAKYPQGEKPDFLIWDLDPDLSVPWGEVMGAAFLLRDFLADRGLTTMVKTSGGKGLHIQLPVKPSHGWDVMKEFTRQVAVAVAALNPSRFTTAVRKSRREGKIFIDYLRNGRGATCIAPWGLRARAGAPVSMPIDWRDLPSVTAAGFTFGEPPRMPGEWLEFERQKITTAHLEEFGPA